MQVKKRGNRGFEPLKLNKITERIERICTELPAVNYDEIAIRTVEHLCDGISTEELDRKSADIAESYKLIHPEYGILAARLCISNLHKSTPKTFSDAIREIHKLTDGISDEFYKFVMKWATELDRMIINENDYLFDYFGFKTLEYGYLSKHKEEVTLPGGKKVWQEHIKDRPQYMWMRVAVTIWMNSSPDEQIVLDRIKTCYKALSQGYFTHATPTLFNAATRNQQMNSCFILETGDSIEEIMKTLSKASYISKWAGGLGISMQCIRPQGSYIAGTGGLSTGLPDQLKMYNDAGRAFNQGGHRPGALAITTELWHGDIMRFLQMKLNNGAEVDRARDLFYAVWSCDLFIKRLINNENWSLFSEHSCPGLSDVYDGMPICTKCGYCENRNYLRYLKGPIVQTGPFKYEKPTNDGVEEEKRFAEYKAANRGCDHTFERRDVFTELYTKYETEGRQIASIPARDIERAIFTAQRESGTPYICNKDYMNRKSNQSNIGTIKSSNLCTEIAEWHSSYSYACCCLASISLKKFIEGTATNLRFNHEGLHNLTRLIVRNLDRIIDLNKYPAEECYKNSSAYRPIAIGIQGLADVFVTMRIPFLSVAAAKLDIEIMETISHAFYTETMALAKEFGSYSEFVGSPASRGVLAPDLWLEDIKTRGVDIFGETGVVSIFSGRYDWDKMRHDIPANGMRNSLGIGHMPTVSSSQILGNTESFEPFPSNIYTKSTLAGKFTIVNNAMIRHLIELGLWNRAMKEQVIDAGGSIQGIASIPADVKEIYKTVWELPQSELMRRTAIRGAFVDQSASLNIHLVDNSDKYLRSVMRTAHKFGLKTGSYYIRNRPATSAMKNNIAQVKAAPKCTGDPECLTCSL